MSKDGPRAADDVYLVPLGQALGVETPLSELKDLDAEQVARYRSFGYDDVRVADGDVFTMCFDAVARNKNFSAADVDAFIYAIEPTINSSNNWMLNEERWKSRDIRWLIQQLEINPARVLGMSFYNCATFLGTVDTAVNFIRAGASRTALSLVAGQVNEHSPRVPHAFHVQSDGAFGFLVTNDPGFSDKYRIVGHVVNYVNPDEFRDRDGTVNESRYFSLKALRIRSTIESVLSESGVSPDELTQVFVQNIGTESMLKYGRLCGVPEERVWLGSLANNAHVIGADTLINFHDYHESGIPKNGDRVLLVGTSGMSWGGMVLEHVG